MPRAGDGGGPVRDPGDPVPYAPADATEVPPAPPAVPPLPDRGEEAPSDPSGRMAGRPPLVLIVEDNVDSAETLASVLEIHGYDVIVANDGPGALRSTSETRPHVVLLDIGLPGMDGYEVARAIRERDRDAAPLLVALTGYGQEEDVERALEAGFAHHLVKPVDITELRRILESASRD